MMVVVEWRSELDGARVMDEVICALRQGNWRQVAVMARSLYVSALHSGDGGLAHLMEELYWLARAALVLSQSGVQAGGRDEGSRDDADRRDV